MPTLFLLFNHRFTAAQKTAASEQLRVTRIISLPPDHQYLWS